MLSQGTLIGLPKYHQYLWKPQMHLVLTINSSLDETTPALPGTKSEAGQCSETRKDHSSEWKGKHSSYQTHTSTQTTYSMLYCKVIRKPTYWKKIQQWEIMPKLLREVTTSALILAPAPKHLFCEFTSNVPNWWLLKTAQSELSKQKD